MESSATVASSILVGQMFGTTGYPVDDAANTPVNEHDSSLGIVFGAAHLPLPATHPVTLNIGLIDCYRFSQECLIKAFDGVQPRITIAPFSNPEECVDAARTDLDLIVYHSHASDTSDVAVSQIIQLIRKAFAHVPLVIMSDAEDAQQSRTIRNTLKNGARGFIPTRTTGIPIMLAALRFIKAGGTFAPLDLLLANQPERAGAGSGPAQKSRLTSRQMAVLSHLQQGKANKTIAHELGMSESTVKVHVRNIMRTVGASNRTQAAFKAQRLGVCRESGQYSGL